MSDEPEAVVPEAINVLLTVEQHQDGKYYIRFNGQEFSLFTPIMWEPQYQLEWPNPVIHFRFSGAHTGVRP